MPYSLTRAEQETIITRAADQAEWIVYTCDPAVKRRLAKVSVKLRISPTIIDRWGVEYRLPLSSVRFCVPRQASEQQKALLTEHLKRARAARGARGATLEPGPDGDHGKA